MGYSALTETAMAIEIIISEQYNPYLNLAVEQELVRSNHPETVVMYLWKNRQTVVIGKHQNPYAECHVERLLAEGGHLMRRTTGGGAVYHDTGNLNFSFVAGKNLYQQEKQFMVIRKALESFGLETELSGRNDILYQGRKFSGNAFSSGKENRLHHGTILIRTDVEKLQRYLKEKPSKLQKHGVASVRSRIINLSEVAGITSENIIPPLVEAFQQVYGEEAVSRPFSSLCTEGVLAYARQLEDPDFLYGKWRQFQARYKGTFAWGEAEIGVEVDEALHRIRRVEIATDCLFPETVEKIKGLLENADSETMPDYTAASEEERTIYNDILHLIYA